MSRARSESAHTGCVDLSSADFAGGSYIMDKPDACYLLTEDVEFGPAADRDFRASQEPYASNPAFALDFFAAIVVQAPGVTINLGGHEIRQSRAHYVQQRFFAVIELADRPFIQGQGPADFSGAGATAPVVHASSFTLRNGRLGLSSHHGIHGNGAWVVLVEDVDIADYEVGAVALNGAKNVVLKRVRALGTFAAVPVAGTYSSARFMLPFVQRALAAAPASAARTRLETASAALEALMQHVFGDVVATGRIDKNTHAAAHALFGNPSGLPDGSASYGFVFHAHGVAVNGFECDRSDSRHDELHHILIEDCEVRNTRLHAVETPALRDVASGKVMRGPAGDILRIAELLDAGDPGKYAGTPLSDTKIALHELALVVGQIGGTTLRIHPVVEQWSRHTGPGLAAAVAAGTLDYVRNCDNMLHVNKGAFAIRIGGGHHVAVRKTDIHTAENTGAPEFVTPLPGETLQDAYYTGGSDGGHPLQDPQAGYMGADAVGIAVEAADNVLIDAVNIRNVHSRSMWATGIMVHNDAANVHLHDVALFNITAFTDAHFQLVGPKVPRAVGICTTTSAQAPTFSGSLEIEDVRAGNVGLACEMLHESTGIQACSAPEVNFYGM
jgi:hypothetical protein